MVEIDAEKEKIKYQAQYDTFMRQLQELEQQKVILIQAIKEWRGIMAFLSSIDKEVKKEVKPFCLKL